MRWTYSFLVAARVEDVYTVASPAKWMSFYLPRHYDGVDQVDESWPAEGASIILRYRFGGLPLKIKQTVVRHDHGRLIHIEETALRGLWTDHNEIILTPCAGGTVITVVSDQTSRFLPLRLLAPLRWLTNWIDIAPALNRFAAMVEAH